MTLEGIDLCKKILSREDAGDIIKCLIHQYADQSFEHSTDIADYCAAAVKSLTKRHIDLMQKTYTALEQCMNQYVFETMNDHTMTGNILFSSMVPVCMVMFPDGTCQGGTYSAIQRQYFQKFVSMLKNPYFFDEGRDRAWAESFGYLAYLRKVLKNIADGTES